MAMPRGLRPLYHGTVALSAGSMTLVALGASAVLVGQAVYGIFRVEVQNARWREDGSASSTTGMLLTTTDTLIVDSPRRLSVIQFCRTTSGAILELTLYGA